MERLKKNKKIVIAVVVVVIIAGIIFFTRGGLTGKKDISTLAKPAVTSVKVYQANTAQTPQKLVYKATLVASEDGIVTSNVGKKVEQILFQNGDSVSAGQPLVILYNKDIKNSIEAAQIALDSAQSTYDRYKVLYDQNAISKSDMEKVESALESAKVSMESLNYSLENTIITSPITGIIGNKNVSLGQYVSPGTVLAKVMNISPIDASIDLKQDDLANVKQGQQVSVKLSDNADAKIYTGFVKNIGVAADSTTRVYACTIELNNPNLELKPGAYAKVEIESGNNKNVIMIPTVALTGTDGNYQVFVNQNNVAKKKTVTVGQTVANMIEIKTGLQDGDSVIITNATTLQDGDPIQVVA